MYGHSQVHPTVIKFLVLVDAKAHLCGVPLAAIAMELGVSVSHLQHAIRRHTGKTCTQLIRGKCVERMASHLRQHPEQTIAEIAYHHGHDPQKMSRHFNAVLGSTPSAVRNTSESRN